jgi:hypothetical protein
VARGPCNEFFEHGFDSTVLAPKRDIEVFYVRRGDKIEGTGNVVVWDSVVRRACVVIVWIEIEWESMATRNKTEREGSDGSERRSRFREPTKDKTKFSQTRVRVQHCQEDALDRVLEEL